MSNNIRNEKWESSCLLHQVSEDTDCDEVSWQVVDVIEEYIKDNDALQAERGKRKVFSFSKANRAKAVVAHRVLPSHASSGWIVAVRGIEHT